MTIVVGSTCFVLIVIKMLSSALQGELEQWMHAWNLCWRVSAETSKFYSNDNNHTYTSYLYLITIKHDHACEVCGRYYYETRLRWVNLLVGGYFKVIPSDMVGSYTIFRLSGVARIFRLPHPPRVTTTSWYPTPLRITGNFDTPLCWGRLAFLWYIPAHVYIPFSIRQFTQHIYVLPIQHLQANTHFNSIRTFPKYI